VHDTNAATKRWMVKLDDAHVQNSGLTMIFGSKSITLGAKK
jgi:hypothetical protein